MDLLSAPCSCKLHAINLADRLCNQSKQSGSEQRFKGDIAASHLGCSAVSACSQRIPLLEVKLGPHFNMLQWILTAVSHSCSGLLGTLQRALANARLFARLRQRHEPRPLLHATLFWRLQVGRHGGVCTQRAPLPGIAGKAQANISTPAWVRTTKIRLAGTETRKGCIQLSAYPLVFICPQWLPSTIEISAESRSWNGQGQKTYLQADHEGGRLLAILRNQSSLIGKIHKSQIRKC